MKIFNCEKKPLRSPTKKKADRMFQNPEPKIHAKEKQCKYENVCEYNKCK